MQISFVINCLKRTVHFHSCAHTLWNVNFVINITEICAIENMGKYIITGYLNQLNGTTHGVFFVTKYFFTLVKVSCYFIMLHTKCYVKISTGIQLVIVKGSFAFVWSFDVNTRIIRIDFDTHSIIVNVGPLCKNIYKIQNQLIIIGNI